MIRDNLQIKNKGNIVFFFFFYKLIYPTSALLPREDTHYYRKPLHPRDILTHEKEHIELQHLVRENYLQREKIIVHSPITRARS